MVPSSAEEFQENSKKHTQNLGVESGKQNARRVFKVPEDVKLLMMRFYVPASRLENFIKWISSIKMQAEMGKRVQNIFFKFFNDFFFQETIFFFG